MITKEALEQFFQNFESFEADSIDEEVRVIGGTGIAFGHFKEKMKTKDGQIQEVVVRGTATYEKINNKWKVIMSHRDTQLSEGN
jgi:ketosteroid isomerase-like protein